jgi:hypothetical protein
MLIVLIYATVIAVVLFQMTKKNEFARCLVYHTFFLGAVLSQISLMALGKIPFSAILYISCFAGINVVLLLIRTDIKKLNGTYK